MNTPTLDPHLAQQITDLSIRLGEAALRNTAGAVIDKMRAIRTGHKEKEQVQQLEEIIYDLIDDKNELREIAEAYKEKFVAQQISEEEITYITESIVPLLKKMIEQAAKDGSTAEAANMQKALDVLTPLLSVETLTVLQLVGFNFKQAIGEPLTLLLQKFIASKVPADPQSNAEQAKLISAFNLEMAKVVQDRDATERWLRLKSN